MAQCLMGSRYDCGSKFGYLEAIVDAAFEHEEYATLSRNSILHRALINVGLEFEVTDTHAGGVKLAPELCARLLADKLSQFRAAQLVVTDRLHGMIMSLLAGTPCLVLPNGNHKISQTWVD